MKLNNLLKSIIITLFSFFSSQLHCQVINDDFEDGNLTGWTEGTAGDWTNSTSTPITGSRSLKHNLSGVSGSSFIYHDISSLDLTTQDITWQFNLKNSGFEPTSGNKFWVYLTANDTDLNSATVDGYAVGVNLTGSSDILTLWKVTDGAADGAIITSTLDWGTTDLIGIKVTRNNAGLWELKVDSDENGNFDNLISQGTATNTDYTFDNNFGLSFTFTSSNAGDLRMDDVTVEGATASSDPTIGFDTATSIENETDATFTSANIPISVTNYSGTQIDINVSITGGTAEGGDYTFTSPTSFSFTGNTTQILTFSINDDADSDDETIIFTITETSSVTDLAISQSTHTVTITDDDLPNIIINEILADPIGIDANNDGTLNTGQDEFIELVNLDGTSYDLTGYTISDATGVNHTFGAVTIPAGGSVVIFGGGTPTGIPGISNTSDSSLSLNNDGDIITLKNATNNTIATYTYGNEANDEQSIGRSDDSTGGFVKHTTIATNPVLASPGRTNVSGLPFSPINWTGTTNNDWATNTNWSSSTAPTISDDVVIPSNLTNYPTAASAVTVNTVTIASGASLIAEDDFTATVTYKRAIDFVSGNLKGWYLMASPVSGQTYNDTFVANNDIASNNSNRGIATYDTENDSWTYLQGAGSGTFTSGQGYSIKKESTSGNVSFTGSLNTSNSGVDFVLATTGNRFNLLGNPYTSFINSATFLNNESAISETKTIWVWNQTLLDNGAYEVKDVDDAMIIAPGQGFFVKANAAGGTFNFTETNQSHNTDTFQKTAETTQIKLWITDGTIRNYNRVKYLDNSTTSFDVGFEGELFNGTINSFAIYSELLESDGKKYQLQSLPNTDYENMVIPIGVIASAGKEITFSAETINIPNGLKVYLEDRLKNTFSVLDEFNNSYKITLTENLNGTGRFYLHTKSEALSTDDSTLQGISVFAINNTKLRIAGIYSDKANIKMYSILGKKITENTFSSQGSTEIDLPNLNTGIYIVQITTEKGEVNKKIILE
jgi:hypothetical protein